MKSNKKVWSAPAVVSIAQMKTAQGGTGSGLSKSVVAIEATFDGPAS